MQMHIPDFSRARILVVGDVMLDRYWHGDTSRISPEAPVPVVHIQQIEERPGGAGNVALNIASLGAKVTLLSICGDDNDADILENKLHAANINCQLLRMAAMTTITKLRVLSLHQQLIRLDFEEKIPSLDYHALVRIFESLVNEFDAVVLSDYGKGALRNAQTLIKIARTANVPVLVDPKGRDFTIYRGASLVTPNRKEFEEVVGVCSHESELAQKGQQLIKDLDLAALIVTRGEHGMTLLRPSEAELHLPTHAKEVYDVTGAGDTVIALLACGLAVGEPLPMAMAMANLGASIVVGKLGAATVTPIELRRALATERAIGRGILAEEQLLIAREDARHHGQRVVFTNGCFDILHAGHVAYLEQAKQLGDRLIVAVNSDASVSRLKGSERPINTLARRLAVLAGLSAVDWVVSFEDDTPERLLELLKPDVLVKGGDRSLDQIVGANLVHSYGGEVQALVLEEGCSTTAIVEKIREQG